MEGRNSQHIPADGISLQSAIADTEQSDQTSTEYEEEFPAYVDLVKDIPPSTPHNWDGEDFHHMPDGNSDSGWQNCLSSVEKYDKEHCQAYREQIDTLLVFAGLFSAVVTAFAVESYQWLQEDPVDASVELLRDMVGLLSQNLNLTAPPTVSVTPRLPEAAVVRINSFWFLSLSLSLSAALVGILCKQWLREYERSVGQSPVTALSVRYIRFRGFEFWKVGPIVTSVPIIMQVALAFFIIGIVELLWRLHTVVACCVTAVAGLTLLFYLATTFLPAIQYAYICLRCFEGRLKPRDYHFFHAFMEPQCAFKSAQAWLAFRVAQPVIDHLLPASKYTFPFPQPPRHSALVQRPADSWVAFDTKWIERLENIHLGPRCAFESLAWIAANLGEPQMSSWIWHCVWARWFKHRDDRSDVAIAAMEITPVASSYPSLVLLDEHNHPLAVAQAFQFQCSLRTDLPVYTALELLLRVARVVGVNSLWTREAIHAIHVVFSDPFRLSDDIAIGLFRLAELQTQGIIDEPDGPNSSTKLNGAHAFWEILVLLHRGSRFRDTFLPAMCGLALQWLRSRPPEPVACVARSVLVSVIRHLWIMGCRDERVRQLREYRGIIFVAKLAGAVAERWPWFARDRFKEDEPRKRAILHELLAMCAEGFPEISRDPPPPEAEMSHTGLMSEGQPSLDPLPPDPYVGETHEEIDVNHATTSGDCSPLQEGHASRASLHC